MLKLKNIKLNNKTLSAEYHPENSDDFGSVAINIENNEIIEKTLSKHDEVFPIYLNHAVDALIKLSKTTTIPKEKLIMWH